MIALPEEKQEMINSLRKEGEEYDSKLKRMEERMKRQNEEHRKAIDYLFIVVKQKRDEAHENQSENARNENPRLRSREGYAWRRGPVKRGRPCLRRYATD